MLLSKLIIISEPEYGGDGNSMGAFDGEDYKALLEMEEFKSHVMLSASCRRNTLLCSDCRIL